MPDHKIQAASALPGALARPDWRPGGELTAGELRLEQKYFLQRLRRHLRLVHGWGVVCGLNVVSANDGWKLCICPGYGIGPCGDEILVNERYCFDLSEYLWTRPAGAREQRVWIGIEAFEEPGSYAAVPERSCGCGCGDSPEKPSRLIDGFQIAVSWTPFPLYRREFDVCSGAAPPCAPCPETCALPLAVVALPPQLEPLLNSSIWNEVA